MSYSVWILRGAQKELSRLPNRDYERLRDRIRALADEPRPHGCSKLAGREGWRLRVGDFRVIYEIDDSGAKVTILRRPPAGHLPPLAEGVLPAPGLPMQALQEIATHSCLRPQTEIAAALFGNEVRI